jgi:hypothetical protein
MTGQTIEIQYRDGRSELITGDDLAGRWDEISEQPGIEYAAWRVPKRSSDGMRLAGVLGIPRAEAAKLAGQRREENDRRTEAAMQAMYDARDHNWNGYTDSLGGRAGR